MMGNLGTGEIIVILIFIIYTITIFIIGYLIGSNRTMKNGLKRGI